MLGWAANGKAKWGGLNGVDAVVKIEAKASKVQRGKLTAPVLLQHGKFASRRLQRHLTRFGLVPIAGWAGTRESLHAKAI